MVTKRTTCFKRINFTGIHISIKASKVQVKSSFYGWLQCLEPQKYFSTSVTKRVAHTLPPPLPLQTAERSAVMWLMEPDSACVRRKVIFPMVQDVFIRSEIQVSQSNSIASPQTQWSSLQVHKLISTTKSLSRLSLGGSCCCIQY